MTMFHPLYTIVCYFSGSCILY